LTRQTHKALWQGRFPGEEEEGREGRRRRKGGNKRGGLKQDPFSIRVNRHITEIHAFSTTERAFSITWKSLCYRN
jgi:hypothetical protein